MNSRFTRNLLLTMTIPMLFWGCAENQTSSSTSKTGFVDQEVTHLDPLGWLGGESQPLTAELAIELDGETHYPGGLVLRSLHPDGALLGAGAQVGDVVVRVEDHWIPLKENPVDDAIRLVEQQISSETKNLTLSVYRGGRVKSLQIAIDRPALEAGLPIQVERFERGVDAALTHLVSWQTDQGDYPPARPEVALATNAMAGLALRAVGAAEEDAKPAHKAALDRTAARITEQIGEASQQGEAVNLSLATLFLAESLGPLPSEILVHSGRNAPVTVSKGKLPHGFSPHGGDRFMTFEISGDPGEDLDSEQIQEMMESMQSGEGGGMQVFTIGGDGESFQLPEGAEIKMLSGGMLPGGMKDAIHGMSGGLKPGEDKSLAELLEEHDPDRKKALGPVEQCVSALVTLQQEDGGWGAVADAESDRLVLTSLALTAMGAARSVGLEIDGEPIEKGCQFLRPIVHEGKIAAAVAKGSDRRVEGGRAGNVALGFLSLGCAEEDKFLAALIDSSDAIGKHLFSAENGVPFSLLSTALLRRQRGIASWQSFYDDFRYRLVAYQHPDGTFAPMVGTAPTPLVRSLSCPSFFTSLGALLLALQGDRLPVLLGRAENPFAPTIDGEGKGTDSKPAEKPTGLPEGMKIPNPEAIQEMLKKMGIDKSLEELIEEGGGQMIQLGEKKDE